MGTSAGWKGVELSGGRYTITDKLGEGGMGLVYRAWDRNLGTHVVIKVPRHSQLGDDETVRRFALEVRSLVQLQHPHIVRVHDAGEHDGLPFAVMQYLPGGSLKDRQPVEADGRPSPMDWQGVRGWLREVAKALDFIHQNKYIHRDVKPANILFDGHDNVFLSDFGIAKALASLTPGGRTSGLTVAGTVFGTPEYMAPEVMLGQAYDGRADQYALAVTVYEVLAGQGPFKGLDIREIAQRQAENKLAPLYRVAPGVPQPVSYLVHRALNPDPVKRFVTCAAFAQAVIDAGSTGPLTVLPVATPAVARPADGGRKAESATSPHGPAPRASAVAPPAPRPATQHVSCPSCGMSLKVRPDMAGKRFACSGCRTAVIVG